MNKRIITLILALADGRQPLWGPRHRRDGCLARVVLLLCHYDTVVS